MFSSHALARGSAENPDALRTEFLTNEKSLSNSAGGTPTVSFPYGRMMEVSRHRRSLAPTIAFRELAIPPRQPGADKLLVQVPAIRQDDLRDRAAVPIFVVDLYGDGLAERQVAGELLRPHHRYRALLVRRGEFRIRRLIWRRCSCTRRRPLRGVHRTLVERGFRGIRGGAGRAC